MPCFNFLHVIPPEALLAILLVIYSLPNNHAHAQMQQVRYEGGDEYGGKARPQSQTGGPVTHILLTEAHMASSGTFHHAHVVHHEEVYLQL